MSFARFALTSVCQIQHIPSNFEIHVFSLEFPLNTGQIPASCQHASTPVLQMQNPIVLASASAIRADLMRNAGVRIQVAPVHVDEAATKSALLQEGASHRDIADALADLKARRAASKHQDRLTLGADQVLSFQDHLLDKPTSPENLVDQLTDLSGKVHNLFSAAVIYENDRPQWRFIGQAQMIMRQLSSDFIDQYVDKNWHEVQHCVGGYQLEGPGAQLFTRVQGDFFSVLGLPLMEILAYLRTRGDLPT